MSGIVGVGRTAPVGAGGGRAAAAGSGFNVPAASGGGVAAAAMASDVGLAGLLALQSEECEPAADREARRHGRDMLDELGRLHRALLGDAADFEGLRRLAELAAGIPQADDQRLGAVLAEITLRVRVELARYGME
jgi:hypothetical protein